MTALKLRFPTPEAPELPLDIGVHGIGRGRTGVLAPVTDGDEPSVRFCVDRRGVWLTVTEGVQGVHVNGRQVRRMAMLRTGDAIFVDGHELRLVSTTPVSAVAPAAGLDDVDGSEPDPRIVLRGVGGRYHGRSFTLDGPRLVGRHAEADIRIDEPGFADRHARLERMGGVVRLTDLGSAEGSVVNGEAMRDAVLQAGDQIVFDAHHRFVIEAPARPGLSAGYDRAPEPQALVDESTAPRGGGLPLPWLLLAAVVIAGLLSALLLFGTA
ncbi:FHA domain-containing protein [Luteimonas sp. 3794]|uniref:FHA domain-containing protein n=1 Tax=Luteimonas sp. 3794 TaxID=2817730 RepID=UPI002859EB8E|nr:FHA domain-containing protein [Luteimonas sp. 3794]MDR6990741.1 pSer/pThr/pTyr-binding forkhead associated (FHA) protein [Luteimonas sp. 3794]